MILWWIGNIIFILVVIPVVVMLLQRLTQPVVEIRQYAADALEHGVNLIAELDSLEELVETRDRARQVNEGVQRYGKALDQLL